ALLVIYTALQWAEQPRNWWRFLAYAASNAVLLYTHYLSGLAVAVAFCLTLLVNRRFTLAATQGALLAVLYAPWVPTLGGALSEWSSASESYEGGNFFTDQIVRLGYLFVSFSFGETHSTASLLLGIVLAP